MPLCLFKGMLGGGIKWTFSGIDTCVFFALSHALPLGSLLWDDSTMLQTFVLKQPTSINPRFFAENTQ